MSHCREHGVLCTESPPCGPNGCLHALRSIGWTIWDEATDTLGKTSGGSSTPSRTRIYRTKKLALAHGHKGAREVFIKENIIG